MFYSVCTPSVFREIELPEDDQSWDSDQEQQFEQLEALAMQHGTYVETTSYQRG